MKRCILIAAMFASLMACNNTPDNHFTMQTTLTEDGDVDVFVEHDLPDDHVITVWVSREYDAWWLSQSDTMSFTHTYHEVSFPAHEWRSGKRLYLSDYDWVYDSGGVLDDRLSLAKYVDVSDDVRISASLRETSFVEGVASLAYVYARADTVVYRPLAAELKDTILDH